MSQIAEQKCPACGAPLRFDPASGKLVCDYCGTVTEVKNNPKKPMKKPSQAASSQNQVPGAGTSAGATQVQGAVAEAGATQGSQTPGAGSNGAQTQATVANTSGTQAQATVANTSGTQAQATVANTSGTQAQATAANTSGTQAQASTGAAATQTQAPGSHTKDAAAQASPQGSAASAHKLQAAQQKAAASAQKPQKPQGAQKEDAAGPVPTDTVEGFDFASITDMVTDPNAMDLPVYNCVSCGAEVIAPPEQMALTCPYCGNNIVLTQKVTGKLRPDGIIPFKIPSQDLPDAVNRFYKDKKLLPRGFFSKSTMGKVTGVYVPFWVFSGNVSGRMEYDAQTSASARSGDYIITTTRHYRLVRDAALAFENLPVDASGRIEDRLMDSLEPFDASQIQPFDMRYLAGFTADRFDQKKDDLSNRAKKRMLSTTSDVVSAQACAGYGAATLRSSNLHTRLDAKYILFPVYMFDISFAGKSYHFAVNGQTGKVVGDIPTDPAVSSMYFLKRFALVSGGLILLSVAKYMLGM